MLLVADVTDFWGEGNSDLPRSCDNLASPLPRSDYLKVKPIWLIGVYCPVVDENT